MPYLIGTFFLILGIVMFINLITKNRKDAKEELLKTLFKKNEITSDTYKKYMDNL